MRCTIRVLPGMMVRLAVPLSLIFTFMYRASTTTCPSSMMMPPLARVGFYGTINAHRCLNAVVDGRHDDAVAQFQAPLRSGPKGDGMLQSGQSFLPFLFLLAAVRLSRLFGTEPRFGLQAGHHHAEVLFFRRRIFAGDEPLFAALLHKVIQAFAVYDHDAAVGKMATKVIEISCIIGQYAHALPMDERVHAVHVFVSERRRTVVVNPQVEVAGDEVQAVQVRTALVGMGRPAEECASDL